MANKLSPFQTLPWKIIDIIAGYAVTPGNRSGCLLSNAVSRAQANPYMTLMHVCHEWRVALMPYALSLSGRSNMFGDEAARFDDTCTVSDIPHMTRGGKPPVMRRMGALESNRLFRRRL
ncbi:hypothetical protein LPJ81_000420 [Coemansia sp. IMI 209127]|nr:hypothetical protein LPJ81_000420 [Coemansia sp. IMI 209127]